MLISYWRRTFNGPPTLTRERRAELLNALLIIMGLGVVALVFISQANTLAQPNMKTLVPELLGLVCVLLCYGLNRWGLTQLAAMLFFLAADALIINYIAVRSERTLLVSLRGVSPILAVPIVAAGVIIGPSYSFVFALISVLSLMAVGIARARPDIPSLETPASAIYQLAVPICLLFVMAGLAWFFESNIHALINRLTSQNTSLNAANRELARKQVVEQQLSRRVNELTKQVAGAFEQQNRRTIEQFDGIVTVTNTIEQLSQSNEVISKAAIEVDYTAREALHVAEEGSASVRSGIQSLLILNEQAQAVAQAMIDLYAQAHQIDQIIELITEVAEETNLLALNATIEAAGAGAYGKRFASVAAEMQRHASRSREAAEQVQKIVGQVSEAIESSSTKVQRTMREASQAMSGTRTMEQALEGMVTMAQNTARLAAQISVSIEQQKQANVNVVQTMQQITSHSQAVAQGSQNLMNSFYELHGAVAELNITSN